MSRKLFFTEFFFFEFLNAFFEHFNPFCAEGIAVFNVSAYRDSDRKQSCQNNKRGKNQLIWNHPEHQRSTDHFPTGAIWNSQECAVRSEPPYFIQRCGELARGVRKNVELFNGNRVYNPAKNIFYHNRRLWCNVNVGKIFHFILHRNWSKLNPAWSGETTDKRF